MLTLFDVCTVIRSKNAGPFTLTFDFIFKSKEYYELAKHSRPISKSLLSSLYGCDESDVDVFYHDTAMAIKASLPQPHFQGELDNGDSYGGQQYVPLLHIEINP